MIDIGNHARAGYPAVCIETFEDGRFTEMLMKSFPESAVWSIASGGGLKDLRAESKNELSPSEWQRFNYNAAFEEFKKLEEGFLVVLDYQHIIKNALAYRTLLETLPICKRRGNMIVLLSPSWTLPAELSHEIPVLQDELPTEEELTGPLDTVLESIDKKSLPEDQRHALLSAARGLTLNEAENALALSAIDGLKSESVENEKLRLVKSRCMSVEKPRSMDELGGLGRLKDYIENEVLPVRDDEQLRVRGMILVGVPGTGKSLAARVIAALMKWPLVRLDIAAAKGSLVGESEATLRHALSIIDAISPAVLWIDEVEKAVGGYQSSASTDGGTTLGMVGALLTWLQEHTSPVLVVATCNDFHKLPPELSRAGRMDERWFLDLPPASEREEIAGIHLRKLGVEVDGLPKKIAEIAEDFTGAEIEQLVKSTARRTGRKITAPALQAAAKAIVPISKSNNIKELREWASGHLRRANDDEKAEASRGRRIK